MATKIHFWSGSVEWAKVYDPDEYNGSSRWVINFYPDNLDEVTGSGCQAQVNEDANGDKFVRLRRDTQKVINSDLVKFAPPRITGQVNVKYQNKLSGEDVFSWSMMENPTLELEQIGDRVTIGNGSKVVVRTAVYDTQRGKGTRLEGLEIKELVEYKSEVSEEQKAADMNGEATTKKATKAKKKEETKEAAPWD